MDLDANEGEDEDAGEDEQDDDARGVPGVVTAAPLER